MINPNRNWSSGEQLSSTRSSPVPTSSLKRELPISFRMPVRGSSGFEGSWRNGPPSGRKTQGEVPIISCPDAFGNRRGKRMNMKSRRTRSGKSGSFQVERQYSQGEMDKQTVVTQFRGGPCHAQGFNRRDRGAVRKGRGEEMGVIIGFLCGRCAFFAHAGQDHR